MGDFVSREVEIKGKPIVEKYGFVKLDKVNNNYMSIYEPKLAPENRKLIIICDTLWDEQERTLVLCAKLGRLLAVQGYTTIKFDYTGCGNSERDNEAVTFNKLLLDLKNIINWCSENFQGINYMSLIAIRAGCHIVFNYPEISDLFAKVILIHPIVNIRHFFKFNYIEQEVVNNNAYLQKKTTLNDLLNQINSQSVIDINGYNFNTSFIKEILNFPELWNCNLPLKNCHYIFDERFYINKKEWGNKLNTMDMEVIKMNSMAFSSWDREDIKDDIIFFQSIFSSILNYL